MSTNFLLRLKAIKKKFRNKELIVSDPYKTIIQLSRGVAIFRNRSIDNIIVVDKILKINDDTEINYRTKEDAVEIALEIAKVIR